MADTLLTLLTDSARAIGVLGQAENLSNSEASDAMRMFNDLIDSWGNESLLNFSNTNETFTLAPNKQTYTMGPGGDFDTVRPQKINNAILTVLGTTNFDLPLDKLNQDQWANITVKQTTSPIPTKFFEQNTFPLTTIWLWPIPSAGNTLTLWSWKPFTDVSQLNSVISWPPGYRRALKYNLALEMAPDFGKEPSSLVVVQAVQSKAAIKRMNNKAQLLACDQALMPSPGAYNYLTDNQ